MTTKQKPVPEMNAEEYHEYLLSLADKEFMIQVAHDIRKAISIVHGYLSLIQLDLEEEDDLREKLEMYLAEMQRMIDKSYMYIDTAEDAYDDRL